MKPVRLRKGDRVAIVSPAGPLNPADLQAGKAFWEARGFEVVLGAHAGGRWGYLAGSDIERAEDLNRAFADPSVSAVICARGGYGASRILDMVDYGSIARNPKIFIGFSDITGFHTAIRQMTGLVTFHGPNGAMPPDNLMPAWNEKLMFSALMGDEPVGEIVHPDDGPSLTCISPGKATGRVVGGNLSLLASTIGTPFEIDTRGKILLVEEVGERPYRIDRMLAQMKMAGKFDGVLGVVIGECLNCDVNAESSSLTLQEVLQDYFARLGRPVMYGLACGHALYRATIPLDVTATIDAGALRFVIEETATV